MEWGGIIWLIILLLGNAFFVGAEFSIMAARRSAIEPKAEVGSKAARTTLYAMEHVSYMLACSQLGITACSLLILQVAEPSIKVLIAKPLMAIGLSYDFVSPFVFVIVLLLVTFLHVTLGEMVPKNLAVTLADKVALVLAPPLVWISRLVRPFLNILNWISAKALKLLGLEPKDEVSASFNREQVETIIHESEKEGLVEDEAGLIAGVLEFEQYGPQDMMVPLERLYTLDLGATPKDFEQAVARTGYSRFMYQDPTNQQLVGYDHIKDILDMEPEDFERPVPPSQMRRFVNVKNDDDLGETLEKMQTTGAHLARVVDAGGQGVGVLFLEDVIEQLVGHISDATQRRDAVVRQKEKNQKKTT